MTNIYDLVINMNKQMNRLSPLRKYLALHELTIETPFLDKQVANSKIGKPPVVTWKIDELVQRGDSERAKISYTDKLGKTYRMVLTTKGMFKESEPARAGDLQKHVYTADGNMFEL